MLRQTPARHHGRKQHLGVHAVHVLLFHSLLSRARAGGVLDPQAKRLPLSGRPTGAQVKKIRFQERLAFDKQRITPVQDAKARRPVPILLRHSVHPALGGTLQVSIMTSTDIRVPCQPPSVVSGGLCVLLGSPLWDDP